MPSVHSIPARPIIATSEKKWQESREEGLAILAELVRWQARLRGCINNLVQQAQ